MGVNKMTTMQRMKSDASTADKREMDDKAVKEHRDANDALTEERRAKADEELDKKRSKNDELTADRREAKDGNTGVIIGLLALMVLASGAIYILS